MRQNRPTINGDDGKLVVSIVIAGDLCPIGRAEKMFLSGDDCFTREVKNAVADADLFIANLECPLTEHKDKLIKGGPHFKANPRCIQGIGQHGINVVSLANNHILDMGSKGLIDTLEHCALAGMKTVGAGENLSNAYQPLFSSLKGNNIAVLSFAEKEFSIASNDQPGAAPIDIIDNYQEIQKAKTKSDYILVLLHAGNEYYHLPSPSLAKLCRFFIDAGASAIVCSHSHVISGCEIYNGCPIIYGTGNFIFDWKAIRNNKKWHIGYMVKLAFSRSSGTSFDLIPYVQFYDEAKVRLLTEEENKNFESDIKSYNNIINDPIQLLKAWSNFCLMKRPEYFEMQYSTSRLHAFLCRLFKISPPIILTKYQLLNNFNLIRCQSHKEALLEIFTQIYNEKHIL